MHVGRRGVVKGWPSGSNIHINTVNFGGGGSQKDGEMEYWCLPDTKTKLAERFSVDKIGDE